MQRATATSLSEACEHLPQAKARVSGFLSRIRSPEGGLEDELRRQQLACLNAIEKAHCVYCGCANGELAYGVESAARIEQYWCPIKHAHRAHGSHACAEHFLAYGNAEDFAAGQERLRRELAPESGDPAGAVQNRSLT